MEALRSGRIETAIVAGSNLIASPASFIAFSQANMLSPKGLCQAFSAGADGFVRAEGAVVFILRNSAYAQAKQIRSAAWCLRVTLILTVEPMAFRFRVWTRRKHCSVASMRATESIPIALLSLRRMEQGRPLVIRLKQPQLAVALVKNVRVLCRSGPSKQTLAILSRRQDSLAS